MEGETVTEAPKVKKPRKAAKPKAKKPAAKKKSVKKKTTKKTKAKKVAKKTKATVIRHERLEMRLSKQEKAKLAQIAKREGRTVTMVVLRAIEKLK